MQSPLKLHDSFKYKTQQTFNQFGLHIDITSYEHIRHSSEVDRLSVIRPTIGISLTLIICDNPALV